MRVYDIGDSAYNQYIKIEKDEETARLGMEITKSKVKQKANMARIAQNRIQAQQRQDEQEGNV